MFTGIIEELGTIRKMKGTREGARLEVGGEVVLRDARTGDSIAVNGVCLTAVDFGAGSFSADVSSETLRRTSLGEARPGTRVNLERPLTPSARLGGHIVQGHVDGTGQFLEARPAGDGWVVRVGFPDALGRYIVEKGSIAVDGISLTVAALDRNWFEIAVIPHTWKMTNLSSLSRGSGVNLEVDIIAKYVDRMMQAYSYSPKESMTLEKLSELGY